MKIDGVHIDGFGEYADTDLPPFSSAVTILYGPNEAGKSTLLAFIRAVLFGFPLRGGAEHFRPLAGGLHGGRLAIASDAGERLTIARHQGTRGGPVTIMAADGSPMAESALQPLLGHAPASTFNSVFAFDLDELQQLESGDEGGINSRIYSAGTGAARLPAALKDLDERAKKLFLHGGFKQPVGKALADLQDIEKSLREAQSQSQEYGEAVEGLERLEAESDDLEGERRDLNAEVEQLRRTEASWDAWLALMDVRDRLAEIPELTNFPEDAVSRLDAFELQLSEAENDVAAAETELERAKEIAAGAIYDGDLLGEAKTIESIQLDRAKFDGFLDSIPRRQADLATIKKDLNRELGRLGAGWDEEKLGVFDSSMPRRDEVRQWDSRLSNARDDLRSSTESRDRATDAIEEATVEHQSALQDLESAESPPFTAEQVAQQRGALRTTRTRLAEYELAAQRRHDEELRAAAAPLSPVPVQSTNAPWPLILGALGVLLLLGGVALSQWLAAASGAVLLAAAGFAWFTARRTTTPPAPSQREGSAPSASRSADDLMKRQDALLAAAALLSLDIAIGELPGRDQLDASEVVLDAAEETLRLHGQLAVTVAEASKLVDRRKKQLADGETLRARHEAAEESTNAEWRDWLHTLDLSPALAPGTALELMAIVETAKAFAAAAEDMRARISGIEREIDEYSDRVMPLAERFLGLPARLDSSATARAADELVRRLADARTVEGEHAEALRIADVCEDRLADAVQRRTRIEEDVAALIAQGGAADAEELRRRANTHSERRGLVQDEREQNSSIRGVWGPDIDFDALDLSFRATTRAATGERLERARVQLSEMDNEIKALSEQRGDLLRQLRSLAGDEEASHLRARREELAEELRTLAGEWSKVVIARSLLIRARTRYEEERQPDVVRRAQTLFEHLTGGRYAKLHVTVGEQEITVIDEDGRRKTPDQLSRGTREQLYLALRFGLIQSMGENAERLPIVVDEILVNFDMDRARRAAAAFVELSRTNQVLVLTCHQWMVELFKEASGGEAAVIDLSTIRAGS